jgi:queuine tRNA-ribosyltransferase
METRRGAVATPAFLPVASRGTVRGLSCRELEGLGVEMLLVNAYHLYLEPGLAVLEKQGGIHEFMGWPGPVLSDSGGYQVFSLAPLLEVGENGVTFRSYHDGSEHLLTPEAAVEIQVGLGVEVAMSFDQPLPYPTERRAAAEATARSDRWAERGKRAERGPGQALFGIVQGGVFPDLREASARRLTGLGFDGYAIGGLSVGEPRELTWEMLELVLGLLPEERPRYLMGMGRPEEMARAVALGVDLFDCVLPTRLGRTGTAFTSEGKVNLRNARFREEAAPLDESCRCEVCGSYSRAYLRHLFKAGEMLGPRLVSYHNLHFYLRTMEKLRAGIREETQEDGKAEDLERERRCRD